MGQHPTRRTCKDITLDHATNSRWLLPPALRPGGAASFLTESPRTLLPRSDTARVSASILERLRKTGKLSDEEIARVLHTPPRPQAARPAAMQGGGGRRRARRCAHR